MRLNRSILERVCRPLLPPPSSSPGYAAHPRARRIFSPSQEPAHTYQHRTGSTILLTWQERRSTILTKYPPPSLLSPLPPTTSFLFSPPCINPLFTPPPLNTNRASSPSSSPLSQLPHTSFDMLNERWRLSHLEKTQYASHFPHQTLLAEILPVVVLKGRSRSLDMEGQHD